MSITVVQSKMAQADAITANPAECSVTFTTQPTIGNFITIQAAQGGGGTEDHTMTFSDNQASGGNTYAKDKEFEDHVSQGFGVAVGSAQITKSSGTFTVKVSMPNATASARYIWIVIKEWSGILTSGALDKTGGLDNHGGPSDTAPDTGTTGTLAQAEELVVAAAVANGPGGVNAFTNEVAGTVPSSGWTEDYNDSGTVHELGDAESVVVSATTGVRHVWTLGTSNRWMTALATYKGGAPTALSGTASTGSAGTQTPGITIPWL